MTIEHRAWTSASVGLLWLSSLLGIACAPDTSASIRDRASVAGAPAQRAGAGAMAGAHGPSVAGGTTPSARANDAGRSAMSGAGGADAAGTIAPAAGTNAPAPTHPDPARPSSGCGKPWMPPDAMMETRRRGGMPMLVARRSIQVAGVERLYLLAVPPTYDPSKAYPFVFGFHGSGGSREQLRGYLDLETPAAGAALFIYPEGLVVRDGSTGWNTSGMSDDLTFVDMLLAQYKSELCIDEGRIFATGHSFGGCMSNTVGCFRGNVFRAIAPVAGCGPNARGANSCVGEVATLQIHSPKDTSTSYSGAISACTRWLRANACVESPMCGCHWTDPPAGGPMPCDQTKQHPYVPAVAVQTSMMDDAPPVLREYEGCKPDYPVIFIEHQRREKMMVGDPAERWHNPPPWAGGVIWSFFAGLSSIMPTSP